MPSLCWGWRGSGWREPRGAGRPLRDRRRGKAQKAARRRNRPRR